MAYNISKGPRDLGDLKNEEDVDTLIDWDQNKITFKTDDTARLVIDNDHVSGSGALEVVGAATVGGNLFVSGSMAMGHGLAGDGALDIKLQNGNPQIIARYSTTHKTNLLTTSNGRFRIAPSARTLEVDTTDTNGGNIHFTKNAAATKAGGIAWNTSNEDVTLYSEADLHLGGGGLSESMFTLDSTGKVGIGIDPTHKLTVAGSISGSGPAHVVGAATFGSALRTTGSISGSSGLQIVGGAVLGNTLNVSGTVSIAQKIEHAGDTDTYIEFTDDNVEFKVGNVKMLELQESTVDKVTVGNGGDVDFQVKTVGQNFTIFAEGSSDKVGICTNSPSDTLTVAGTISGSSTLHNVGATSFGGTVAASGSITAGTSFIIGAADINETDLEKLDGITNGTVTANKAVVVDASKNIATLGTIGCGAITSTGASTFAAVSASSALQAVGPAILGSTLKVSGACTFDTITVAGTSGGEGAIFEQGLTIKNADASAGFINFYEQSSNGTNVCTFRGKSSMGNCTITLPGDTGTVVLEDNTVTLSNKTIATPTITGNTTAAAISGSGALQVAGTTVLGSTLSVSGGVTLIGAVSSSALFHNVAPATFGSTLATTGSITSNGLTCTGVVSGSGVLHNVGAVTMGSNLSITGNVGIGGVAGVPSEKLDINGDGIRIRVTKTPANASAAGNPGQICWDANYIYVCVSSNSWKRVAISAW